MRDSNQSNKKATFRWIAALLFAFVGISSTISEIDDSIGAIFLFILFPGFVLYVLVTGDIHGWQPGPIGHTGRVAVTTIGSFIFWLPIVYWIYRKRKR